VGEYVKRARAITAVPAVIDPVLIEETIKRRSKLHEGGQFEVASSDSVSKSRDRTYLPVSLNEI